MPPRDDNHPGVYRDNYDSVEIMRHVHREHVREIIKEYAPDPEVDAIAQDLIDHIFKRVVHPERVKEAMRVIVQGYREDAQRFLAGAAKLNMDRWLRLEQRMDLLEDDLFDPDTLGSMSNKEKVFLYKQGMARQQLMLAEIFRTAGMESAGSSRDEVPDATGLDDLPPAKRHALVMFLDIIIQKMAQNPGRVNPDIVDAEFKESGKPRKKKKKKNDAG